MIAGVSGLALLLIMSLFSWFGIKTDPATGFQVSFTENAWGSFGFIDLILLITLLAAVGYVVISANSQSVNTPVAVSAIVAGLGILSVVLILFRIVSPPDLSFGGIPVGDQEGIDKTRGLGAFLGLIAAAGIAAGGWLAMHEEGTGFSSEADRLGGSEHPRT